MKLTYGQLRQMVEEAYKLREQNVSGGAGGYMTPRAFGGKKPNKVMRQGMKSVQRPKRPSHTKMFDYLEENNK